MKKKSRIQKEIPLPRIRIVPRDSAASFSREINGDKVIPLAFPPVNINASFTTHRQKLGLPLALTKLKFALARRIRTDDVFIVDIVADNELPCEPGIARYVRTR
jgi:hypothetical protein